MTDATLPNPPRHRWLKRLGLGMLVVVVGLLLLRLVWGRHTQAELDQVVEAARAQGYPVLFDDLEFEPVPPSENMAVYIRQALAAVPAVNAQGQTLLDTDWWLQGGAEEARNHGLPDPIIDDAAYLRQLQPTLDALRAAAILERADWGRQITRPVINMKLPDLREVRELAYVLTDAVLRAFSVGEDALAIELISHCFTLGRAKLQPNNLLIDTHTAIALRWMGIRVLEHLLPRLPRDPGLRQPLEQLLAQLLDESGLELGLRSAYITERWQTYDALEGLLAGQYGTQHGFWFNRPIHAYPMDYDVTRWFFRPYYLQDAVTTLDHYAALVRAAHEASDLPAFNRLGGLAPGGPSRLGNATVLHPFSDQWVPGFGGTGHLYFRHLAVTRMCAAAIAIKLYEINHFQRPASLKALVPEYLPAVPTDPLADDGRPIGYLPAGAVPIYTNSQGSFSGRGLGPGPVGSPANIRLVLLYCVGFDGDDDGGLIELDQQGAVIDDSGYFDAQGDMWFLLDRLP